MGDLPRQSMHRAGAPLWTLQTLSLLLGPTDALLAVCSFLCLFSEQPSLVRLGYHGTFFYLYLANHSAVGKWHPMGGAEIDAGCGIPGCSKLCCSMCTPSVVIVVQPAGTVCCFFVAITLLFPTSTIFCPK